MNSFLKISIRIGGSTGGTAAGLQASKSGAATIIIVEQTTMLGGMLTAVAVCTDGNDGLKTVMWQELVLRRVSAQITEVHNQHKLQDSTTIKTGCNCQ